MTTPETSLSISDTVRYTERQQVALIRIDNLPVNGLGDTVRRGVADALKRALANSDVKAVVVLGEGKVFCGGADIRQFNTPAATAKPMLRDVNRAIERSTKPVVACIHGVALGGGLELALACHYRIADASAKLGLPEVNLGLVPGGGGTQRLPRLIGVTDAVRLISSGKQVGAKEAASLGLIDEVFEGDREQAAIAFALAQAAQQTAWPVLADKAIAADGLPDFDALRAAVNPKARNAIAQRMAVSSVEAAVQLPFEQGLDKERALFDELVAGTPSKALRHMFFAEKESAKFTGSNAREAARPVRSVGILGAGTMGGGIAMAFANAGIPVVLCEREQAALDRGMALIERNYQISVARGGLTQEGVKTRLARIQTSLDMAAFAEVDLVIEAVFEDMAVKRDVFTQLDRIAKRGAILATNTSRLNINEIAAATQRPEDVIGLHFFSPANVMKLLEVVRGELTSDAVIAGCMQMAVAIGKIPVLVGVCEGFVGNRMLTGYWREAGFLLEEGATVPQIDAAMQAYGFAMGPLAMADLAGMDINWATRKRLAPTRPAHLRYSKVADRICEQGRFGQKTSAGYYRYEAGNRTPIPDPVVEELIAQCAKEAGIERRQVTDEEIVERCVLALVNEGARIVDEGIAQRASDVDVVYVNGYGFPAWRGGPMFYAETLGWKQVRDKIHALHTKHGEHWIPAPWIDKQAQA
ncbi:3-hydroxyacyl-CoA dehydrogenase [Diaphorobacter sp. HDW4A]|uniref:3-hydroxyacyl-CoA dehydrogenase NAD-binding domain-containing protein n=1 Tax=Diaphorobacter sp. HDW4A TaxID=2714924 RepID=UPI0014090315|nr:3-hydroxyacyl-CoA dehydrogenase NAD-binding domain-containing protein [Diaphorobacter sp. HDW4A]QIL79916.1 3-hydroxyacyl-CoA dehydrogenase [Diaphorobacter sp. HDW4A]